MSIAANVPIDFCARWCVLGNVITYLWDSHNNRRFIGFGQARYVLVAHGGSLFL